MTDRTPPFRSVMRGYDPAQVEAHLAELGQALDAARREAGDRTVELSKTQSAHADLTTRLEQARRQVAALEEAQRSAAQPTYQDLGQRIGHILTLADEEAAELRARAQAEAQEHRAAAEAAARAATADADRYVEEARTKADAQAAQVLEDARRRADALLDEADRAALARREEAEALYESQRAKVSAAAADFETTLASRRQKAAEEFAAELASHQRGLAEVQERAATLAQESDAAHADARGTAQALLERARTEAEQLVTAAREQAARVRSESERELAAATARRDSINAQLANVRQMLATLGGAALAQQAPLDPLPEPPAEGASDAPAEEAPARAEDAQQEMQQQHEHEQQHEQQHEHEQDEPARTH